MLLPILLLGSLAVYGYTPGAGLIGTPHDFSGIPAGGALTGLCTFCHTPHQAIETTLLQNHTPSPVTFRWCKETETQYGTPFPTIPSSYRGPSVVCLGCHSETVTVGDIRWFNEASWTGSSTLDSDLVDGGADPDGCIHHPHSDHPTALPYPYQGVASTYNGVTSGAEAVETFAPDPTVFGIKLYRDEAGIIQDGPVAGRAGIECPSCHDPHNGPSVESNHFIRGTESSLCKTCHKD
jgi:predicted CXXCH cytochrome family protein